MELRTVVGNKVFFVSYVHLVYHVVLVCTNVPTGFQTQINFVKLFIWVCNLCLLTLSFPITTHSLILWTRRALYRSKQTFWFQLTSYSS